MVSTLSDIQRNLGVPFFEADDTIPAEQLSLYKALQDKAAAIRVMGQYQPTHTEIIDGKEYQVPSGPAIPAGGASPMDFMRTLGITAEHMVSGLFESLKSGLTLPGDVAAGKVDPLSREGEQRALDLAGLPALGITQYPVGSIGVFGSRLRGNAAESVEESLSRIAQAGGDLSTMNPRDVLRQTGLSKDYHGNWVYEINDANADLTPHARGFWEDPSAATPHHQAFDEMLRHGDIMLTDILDHPDLFDAFPYLENTKIKAVHDEGTWGAEAGLGDNSIILNMNSHLANGDNIVSTLLHEVQHLVNNEELKNGVRRSVGANPETTLAGFERMTRLVERAYRRGVISREQGDQIYDLLGNMKSAYDIYARNPGEVEARNVQERMSFGAAQRRAIPPETTQNIPFKDQLDLNEFDKVYQHGVNEGVFENVPNDFAPRSIEMPKTYSALERFVESGAKSAPAEQWLGSIRNAQGLKGEELEWTRVEKWLEDRKGQQVTRGELANFVRENTPEVKEVVKGVPEKIKPEDLKMEKLENGVWNITYPNGKTERWGDNPAAYADVNQSEDIIRKLATSLYNNGIQEKETLPKYGSYQTPGGKNYREILQTLPSAEHMTIRKSENHPGEYDVVDSNGAILTVSPDLETAQQVIAERERLNKSNYSSSHWDEPNVLFHTRVNDRMIEGKNTLFAEELQSDWHQTGRKQGYKQQAPEGLTAEKLTDGLWTIRDKDGALFVDGVPAQTAEEAVDIAKRNAPVRGVPNAPFKKSWPDLALKNLVRRAVDEGKDQVAWLGGEGQAERYDLSKQVSHIEIGGRDGKYIIDATPIEEGSLPYTVAEGIEANELSNYVGKELAEKAVDALNKQNFSLANNRGNVISANKFENETDARAYIESKNLEKDFGPITVKPVSSKRVVFSGLDLKVGGEGMKAFYDKELPNRAKKLFGKLGGKVKETTLEVPSGLKFLRIGDRTDLPAGEQEYIFETPGGADHISMEGTSQIDAERRLIAWFERNGYREADKISKPQTHKIHILEITPEMKAQAKRGFPLFTGGVPMTDEDNE